MPYTFSQHLHNYACWTAARAVQRGFTTTENIVAAINQTTLRAVAENGNIHSADEYDAFHRQCCEQLITALEPYYASTSYGRAAKIIAVYIKTAVVIRHSGEGDLAKVAHPPIDRILLTNLGIKDINWTQLDEEAYFDLIQELRAMSYKRFWEIEEHWTVGR